MRSYRRMTGGRVCLCDHSENAHQHNHHGTYCGLCGCNAFLAQPRVGLRGPAELLARFIVRRRVRRWLRHVAVRPAVTTVRRHPTTGLFE